MVFAFMIFRLLIFMLFFSIQFLFVASKLHSCLRWLTDGPADCWVEERKKNPFRLSTYRIEWRAYSTHEINLLLLLWFTHLDPRTKKMNSSVSEQNQIHLLETIAIFLCFVSLFWFGLVAGTPHTTQPTGLNDYYYYCKRSGKSRHRAHWKS